MHRRTLLRGLAAAAGLCLAGCTSPPGETGGDGGENGDDGSPTDDDPGGAVTERNFDVHDVSSTSGDGGAEVAFEPDSNRVRVTGTIIGSDGCKTAKLDDVSLDGSELAVSVITVDREGSEDRACTMALVGIDYEATVSVEGDIPDVVTVDHDGEGVTTGRRDDGD